MGQLFTNLVGDVRNWAVNVVMTSLLGGVILIATSIGKAVSAAFRKEPVPWTILVSLCAVGVILTVVSIVLLIRWRKPKQNNGNAERNVRRWLEAQFFRPKVLTDEKLYFGFVVELPPHIRVIIRRSKENPSCIELRNSILTIDKQRARFDEMSEQERESVLRAIQVEFNRSKIGPPHLGKKLEFICLHRDISIDPDLTGARLIDGINDMKFAHGVIHPMINSLLKPPSVLGQFRSEPVQQIKEPKSASKHVQGFSIDALEPIPDLKNRTQVGSEKRKKVIFTAGAALSVRNVLPAQGIDLVSFRLLSITPPMDAVKVREGHTQDSILECVDFSAQIRSTLPAGKANTVRLFKATRPPAAKSLKDISVQFYGKWPDDNSVEFIPQERHEIVVETTGNGVSREEATFQFHFSCNGNEPVFSIKTIRSAVGEA